MTTREAPNTRDRSGATPLVPLRRVSASVIAAAFVRVLGDQDDDMTSCDLIYKGNKESEPMAGSTRRPPRIVAACGSPHSLRFIDSGRALESFYPSDHYRKTYSGGPF